MRSAGNSITRGLPGSKLWYIYSRQVALLSHLPVVSVTLQEENTTGRPMIDLCILTYTMYLHGSNFYAWLLAVLRWMLQSRPNVMCQVSYDWTLYLCGNYVVTIIHWSASASENRWCLIIDGLLYMCDVIIKLLGILMRPYCQVEDASVELPHDFMCIHTCIGAGSWMWTAISSKTSGSHSGTE